MMPKMRKINKEFAKPPGKADGRWRRVDGTNTTDYLLINRRKYNYTKKGSDSPYFNPKLTVAGGNVRRLACPWDACAEAGPSFGRLRRTKVFHRLNQFELGF